MSFAENKTKTLHDCVCSWSIGSSVKHLRFLGYWLETPPPPSRTAPPSFVYHVSRWITKANLAFNTLRALSLRSSTGLQCTIVLISLACYNWIPPDRSRPIYFLIPTKFSEKLKEEIPRCYYSHLPDSFCKISVFPRNITLTLASFTLTRHQNADFPGIPPRS